MVVDYIVSSLWLILPAYVANAAPVFVKKLKTTHPIDGGRLFFDGLPVLGAGKTWEGILFAVVLGAVTGAIQVPLNSLVTGAEIKMTIQIAILLSTGAMVGDAFASFLKRRVGLKRGESVFLLDQLDFLVVAILFAGISVIVPVYIWGVLLVLTPVLNYLSNFLAYHLKLKDVWW